MLTLKSSLFSVCLRLERGLGPTLSPSPHPLAFLFSQSPTHLLVSYSFIYYVFIPYNHLFLYPFIHLITIHLLCIHSLHSLIHLPIHSFIYSPARSFAMHLFIHSFCLAYFLSIIIQLMCSFSLAFLIRHSVSQPLLCHLVTCLAHSFSHHAVFFTASFTQCFFIH